MSYKVKIQTFEGPFDLLVYLIENAQMSIYDIEISSITEQYLEYIRTMREMDVNVATEFMVLASSLIEIKSKMILPRINTAGEMTVEDDPRTELVTRLLEYKRFKKAAEILQEQEERAGRIFSKPQEDISCFTENPDEYLALDIRQFAGAFSAFIEKKQKLEAVRRQYTRINREKVSMENRITYIAGRLRVPDKKDKYDTIITFVSLLEMAKERVVNLSQKVLYGDIEVEAGEKINEGEFKYEQ